MAFLLIPTPTSGYPDQTMLVPINGITYTIRWSWNERGNAWYFDLSDPAGPLLTSVRVALGIDLIAYVSADPRAPQGMMFVDSPDGSWVEPGQYDLGNRVKVVFVDQADVEAAKAATGA